MNLLTSIFGKTITLTKEMEEMADKLIANDWFSNCGKKSSANIKFQIAQENTIDEVEKKLSYKKDIKGFVTLDNLLIEAGRRSELFLSLYHQREKENTWNKLTDAIVNRYIANNKFDFDSIEHTFSSQYDITVNLEIRRIFIDVLKEIYFKNKIENYPIFLIDVIDVYLKGNVIIGWLGKFGSHEVQVKEIFPITPRDGVLSVW